VTSDSALFNLSQTYFQSILADLAQAGLRFSPALQLREAEGLLCYYDLHTQVIYLALPDKPAVPARLQLLLLRSLFACDSDTEVFDFLRLVLYWLVCHEVAHHLRHYHGLLSANVWHEEQIANQLAVAMSKPRFTTAEGFQTHGFLQRATRNLASKMDPCNNADPRSNAVNSYRSLAEALRIAGLIDETTRASIAAIKAETGLLCDSILRQRLVQAPDDIEKRLHHRYQIIRHSRGTLQQNIFSHLYYYFAWMDIALMSAERFTIPEFARHYLNTTD
jgi:hypothetical protein